MSYITIITMTTIIIDSITITTTTTSSTHACKYHSTLNAGTNGFVKLILKEIEKKVPFRWRLFRKYSGTRVIWNEMLATRPDRAFDKDARMKV